MAKKKKKAKKKTKAQIDIEKCWKTILTGSLLCIDPSSGSGSSMPGYAIYQAGELLESGIVEIENVSKSVPIRLRELGKALREEFEKVDVLVIESIPPIHGGGGMRLAFIQAKSHASLLKSVGCILGAVDATHVVEIHPRTWQKYRDENYSKEDHKDAEYIGKCALIMAKEMTGE